MHGDGIVPRLQVGGRRREKEGEAGEGGHCATPTHHPPPRCEYAVLHRLVSGLLEERLGAVGLDGLERFSLVNASS